MSLTGQLQDLNDQVQLWPSRVSNKNVMTMKYIQTLLALDHKIGKKASTNLKSAFYSRGHATLHLAESIRP